MFIEQGGDITCVVIDNRRYSSDLGLEILWTLVFHGMGRLICKIKKLKLLKKKLHSK